MCCPSQAVKPCLADPKESALQKKGYKVLSYLCEHRPSFLRTNLKDVLSLVAGTTCLSAAKRYRLKTLKPLIIVLAGSEELPEGVLPAAGKEGEESDEEEDEGMGGEEGAGAGVGRRQEVVASLVGDSWCLLHFGMLPYCLFWLHSFGAVAV